MMLNETSRLLRFHKYRNMLELGLPRPRIRRELQGGRYLRAWYLTWDTAEQLDQLLLGLKDLDISWYWGSSKSSVVGVVGRNFQMQKIPHCELMWTDGDTWWRFSHLFSRSNCLNLAPAGIRAFGRIAAGALGTLGFAGPHGGKVSWKHAVDGMEHKKNWTK